MTAFSLDVGPDGSGVVALELGDGRLRQFAMSLATKSNATLGVVRHQILKSSAKSLCDILLEECETFFSLAA